MKENLNQLTEIYSKQKPVKAGGNRGSIVHDSSIEELINFPELGISSTKVSP